MPVTIAPDPALTTTSTTPAAPRENVPRSAAAFLAMMAALVVLKLAIDRWFPGAFASPQQAKLYSWMALGILTVTGLIATWCASRTGFPETWDPEVPLTHRLVLPIAVGLALGALAILVDDLTGWTVIVAKQLNIPTIQIRYPASALIYPGGALISNIVTYAWIPILMWLAGLATRGRWERERFWVFGTLCALIEPIGDFGLVGHPGIVAVTFAQDFALNIAQVYTFRRAGFASSVVLRVAFYLVWHVMWGAIRG